MLTFRKGVINVDFYRYTINVDFYKLPFPKFFIIGGGLRTNNVDLR